MSVFNSVGGNITTDDVNKAVDDEDDREEYGETSPLLGILAIACIHVHTISMYIPCILCLAMYPHVHYILYQRMYSVNFMYIRT